MTDNEARGTESAADIRATLRRHLRECLIAGDKVALDVIRVAVAAIENAEAQPLDGPSQTELHLAASKSSDIPRRIVSDDEARVLVADQIEELLTAARHHASLGEPDSAVKLESQAEVLRLILLGRG